MSKPDADTPPQGEIVIYQTEDGNTRIEVRFVDEAVRLAHRRRLYGSVVHRTSF